MPRIVSVWLEHWPITRLRRARGDAPWAETSDSPTVVAALGPGGLRLTALDANARAMGLQPGEPLARARARIGTGIVVHPADRPADAAALERLCLWAMRYTPVVVPFRESEGGDGFFLDVSGSSHLFGGEEALVSDLAGRLSVNAIPARIALADTPGAAFALARHSGPGSPRIVAPGAGAAALRGLPVIALRIDPAIAESLRKLGLRRIGALADAPRAPLARRFGEALLLRLDQALGHRPEPFVSLSEAPAFSASRGFLDPIGHQNIIVATVRHLMEELAHKLAAAGLGARCLRLILHRVDGHSSSLDLGLSEPTRCESTVARLLDLRLDRLGPALDAGFGFETLRLDVTAIGLLAPGQAALAIVPALGASGLGPLADALRQRIGRRAIRLEPRASHIPERAAAQTPWRVDAVTLHWPGGGAYAKPRRPLVLLRRGEAAEEVIALAPDGPPQRFRWRRRLHRITHAEGPERIAGEWWHETAPTRDYYLVEDESGCRLWLYREGNYSAPPVGWFVQGLFA